MAKFEKRLRALKLRREGWSIKFIARRLEVSKGTASIWCRDIRLTPEQNKKLIENAIAAGHRGGMVGARINKEKKEKIIQFYKEDGRRRLTFISGRSFLIAGLSLYWAEGSKKSKLAFVNSEPEMIKFMHFWFESVMGVKEQEFMPRIFINEMHQPRIKKVLKFWSELLHLPVSQFGNPVFLKHKQKKVYENYENYYGVLALGVRKSSELKYQILGLIDALRSSNIAKVAQGLERSFHKRQVVGSSPTLGT